MKNLSGTSGNLIILKISIFFNYIFLLYGNLKARVSLAFVLCFCQFYFLYKKAKVRLNLSNWRPSLKKSKR